MGLPVGVGLVGFQAEEVSVGGLPVGVDLVDFQAEGVSGGGLRAAPRGRGARRGGALLVSRPRGTLWASLLGRTMVVSWVRRVLWWSLWSIHIFLTAIFITIIIFIRTGRSWGHSSRRWFWKMMTIPLALLSPLYSSKDKNR